MHEGGSWSLQQDYCAWADNITAVKNVADALDSKLPIVLPAPRSMWRSFACLEEEERSFMEEVSMEELKALKDLLSRKSQVKHFYDEFEIFWRYPTVQVARVMFETGWDIGEKIDMHDNWRLYKMPRYMAVIIGIFYRCPTTELFDLVFNEKIVPWVNNIKLTPYEFAKLHRGGEDRFFTQLPLFTVVAQTCNSKSVRFFFFFPPK